MGKSLQRLKDEAIANFRYDGVLIDERAYGSGHINDTYRLTYGTGKHYILQKMNRSIFTKPVELMENVSGVTAWLKKNDPGKRWRCGERDSESCDDKGWTSLLCR